MVYSDECFEAHPVSKVGVAIRKNYGVEVFRKAANEDVFCCYIKLHSDGRD